MSRTQHTSHIQVPWPVAGCPCVLREDRGSETSCCVPCVWRPPWMLCIRGLYMWDSSRLLEVLQPESAPDIALGPWVVNSTTDWLMEACARALSRLIRSVLRAWARVLTLLCMLFAFTHNDQARNQSDSRRSAIILIMVGSDCPSSWNDAHELSMEVTGHLI
jgi:hypothetical protein